MVPWPAPAISDMGPTWPNTAPGRSLARALQCIGSQFFAWRGFVRSYSMVYAGSFGCCMELTLAISPARDRRSLSAGPSADKRNPDRKRGVGGPEICLGMGSYRSRSVLVRLEIGGDLNLPNGMLLMGALGDGKPRLRRIEATYRKTRRQDSRDCGLLAGVDWPEVLASVQRKSRRVDWCSQDRPLPI